MFEIIKILDDAPLILEQLGSRRKFWYLGEDGRRYLFKEGRPNTGENWSEKVTSEFCELLGIPHAAYELAVWRGLKGVLSPSFMPDQGRLIHGNELLAKFVPHYDASKRFRQRHHTLDTVLALLLALEKNKLLEPPIGWGQIQGIKTAVEVFIGYLMLDAWIANQDRHHENWGLITVYESERPKIHLAPTFDHASSLGRNETDKNRQERLITKNEGKSIKHYVERARSAFYLSLSDSKAMLTLEAFQRAAKKWPDGAKVWLERLENVSTQDTHEIFDRLPKGEITSIAIEFAQTMLILNRERLLDIKRKLP